MPRGRPKGYPKTGGRPKGAPNKITSDLRAAILMAAEAAGGEGGTVAYLTLQAQQNPGPFLTLLGKVLPTQVTGEGGGPITFRTIYESANPGGDADH
jgi:hypothetical protein